jgi:hypothetical protein
MNQNPFATETFARIWSKHFNNLKTVDKFNFINHVLFAQLKAFPLFYNVGNKLTNGNFYTVVDNAADFKGKTFLIRDIPSYYNISLTNSNELKTKFVFQYRGYTTQVTKYNSLDDYLRSIYKSNTRSKLRRNINRLEACFDVEYIMYYGDISENTYNFVFQRFYKLFEKRYADKGEPCGELEPKLWSYYTELGLALINEKKASLFVIYCNKVPVGITFSYHIEDILIEALTVFDIDFYKFNIGHTSILKMLEWSFENKIRLFDYTQGNFEYKKRWSDSHYDTYYHVLYDSKSVQSSLLANFMTVYFNSKRLFRDLKLNTVYHNVTQKIFGRNNNVILNSENYKVQVVSEDSMIFNDLFPVDIQNEAYSALRRALYDFLYMNPEKIKNINVFQLDDSTYYARGINSTLRLTRDDE